LCTRPRLRAPRMLAGCPSGKGPGNDPVRNARGRGMRKAWWARIALLAGIAATAVVAVTATGGSAKTSPLSNIKHIVVIYEENHSFDNLYGTWEGVNGLSNA